MISKYPMVCSCWLPKPYCDKPHPHHIPPSRKPVQYPYRNSTVASGKGTLGTLGQVERDRLFQSSQRCRSPGRTLEPEERKINPQDCHKHMAHDRDT